MIDINTLLNAKSCEDIFENNEDVAKKLYRQLAKQYHPDTNSDPNAAQAFQRLQELFTEAKDKFEKGIWNVKNLIVLKTKNNKTIRFKYDVEKTFELGICYVGKEHIMYVFEEKHKKYYENAKQMIGSIKYADSNMEKEFSKLMPKIVASYQVEDGRYLIVLKNNKMIPISTLMEEHKEKITDRHVAWILSRVNNLNCFLSFNKIVLNGINTDNCFIDTDNHSVALYGGWWYARPENEKMIGTTGEIFSVMPIKNKTEKIALHSTDMESIRKMAKKILYNPNTTPKAFIDWLEKGSSEDAFKEFSSWNDTLDKAYGERKFIKF